MTETKEENSQDKVRNKDLYIKNIGKYCVGCGTTIDGTWKYYSIHGNYCPQCCGVFERIIKLRQNIAYNNKKIRDCNEDDDKEQYQDMKDYLVSELKSEILLLRQYQDIEFRLLF